MTNSGAIASENDQLHRRSMRHKRRSPAKAPRDAHGYRYPLVIGMRRSFPNARCEILIPIGA